VAARHCADTRTKAAETRATPFSLAIEARGPRVGAGTQNAKPARERRPILGTRGSCRSGWAVTRDDSGWAVTRDD